MFVLKLLRNKSNKNQSDTITSWIQNEPRKRRFLKVFLKLLF